jgi:hypothetical protein
MTEGAGMMMCDIYIDSVVRDEACPNRQPTVPEAIRYLSFRVRQAALFVE